VLVELLSRRQSRCAGTVEMDGLIRSNQAALVLLRAMGSSKWT